MAQLYRLAQGDDPFRRKANPPGAIEVNGEEHWEVEKIVKRRVRWRNGKPFVDYLVRSAGFEADLEAEHAKQGTAASGKATERRRSGRKA